MFNATVNMGGSRMESGTDYVATITDIVPMKAVIQYPKELRWDAVNKKMRTVSDLSNDERAVFEVSIPIGFSSSLQRHPLNGSSWL